MKSSSVFWRVSNRSLIVKLAIGKPGSDTKMLCECVTDLVMHLSTGKEVESRFFFLPVLMREPKLFRFKENLYLFKHKVLD
jgi:hypothetical protein